MAMYNDVNVISGNFGKMWFDGVPMLEVTALTATITANRADVQIGMDIGSKVISLQGEGSFTYNKVYSTNIRRFVDAWKSGRDVRVTITSTLSDPDAVGGQVESFTIGNVALNEATVANWVQGDLTPIEQTFRFTASDLVYNSSIEQQ